jgi:hypothetical protein
MHCLLHCSHACKHREAVATLTAALSVAEDVAGESSRLEAARFQWAVGETLEAQRLLNGLKLPLDGDAQSPLHSTAFALRGWVELSLLSSSSSGASSDKGEALRWLERSAQPRDLDTIMGKVRNNAAACCACMLAVCCVCSMHQYVRCVVCAPTQELYCVHCNAIVSRYQLISTVFAVFM